VDSASVTFTYAKGRPAARTGRKLGGLMQQQRPSRATHHHVCLLYVTDACTRAKEGEPGGTAATCAKFGQVV
jgi:hypothetical protein